uniref:Transcriptional regulatory protein n=1 Tax=Aegilops tauschii TaxID=37682 RepID=M8B7J4_AEGTA
MASAARALGALIHRASSLSSSASALRSASLVHRNGPTGGASLFQGHVARRRISTFQPLCMGRRSCKIAGRKVTCSWHALLHHVAVVQIQGQPAVQIFVVSSFYGRKSAVIFRLLMHILIPAVSLAQGAQNLKKMKRNSKIGKEIVAAIKKGGPSPSSNTALAAILEKVRELDVPKEVVERNIKRASEKGQDTYTEKIYEVYGFGGVGMVVEVLTDKITRSIADIRNVVKDCGAKLADPGSVTFRFRQARVVNIKVTDADKDQLLSVALDAGADDVIEPNFDDEDDSEEEVLERFYKIVTTSENYPVVLSKLQEEGLKFETDNGYELLPLNPIEVDDEAMELNKDLVFKLLELDDVDAVYTDQK